MRISSVGLALLAASCGATALTTPTPITRRAPTRPAATTEPQSISFATRDGATLAGTLYGQGATAVIFSNRSDKGQESWAMMAQRTAAAGYLAMTYDYRAWRGDGRFDLEQLNQADIDLLGAVAFARSAGARSIVLVGASLGGIASLRAVTTVAPAALVVLGAPLGTPALTIRVEPDQLQYAVPKLFIASKRDSLVAAAETRRMYDLAAEPKTYYEYDTDSHATDLLLGPLGDDLSQRLLDFIQLHAPAL